MEEELERLEAPRDNELSGANIRIAEEELFSFFVRAYHLKDALIAALPNQLTEKDVEAAITQDPDLALLADLANLDKHFQLNKSPRSGQVPVIGPVTGKQAGSGEGGWRLNLEITHGGHRLDGLQLARRTVEAWRRRLAGWGLL